MQLDNALRAVPMPGWATAVPPHWRGALARLVVVWAAFVAAFLADWAAMAAVGSAVADSHSRPDSAAAGRSRRILISSGQSFELWG